VFVRVGGWRSDRCAGKCLRYHAMNYARVCVTALEDSMVLKKLYM
jgi:hypothetical protein